MRIGVIGAGIQGNACVRILAKEKDVETITVIDKCVERLDSIISEIPSSKISCHVCDIKDAKLVKSLLQGCDVIFDMLIPEFTEYAMRAALDVRAHYINTAYDDPFWKCIVEGKELPLNREFEAAGLTAMLGCGDSPGFVNVFVKKYCDLFDSIDSIRICGAYKNPKNENCKVWNPGWSRKQAYLDFITPPVVFEDGSYIFKEQFSNMESVSFGEYGERRIALHSHEEVYSIPLFIGKNIQNCEFKYEVDPYAYKMYLEGYAKDAYVMENGKKICALDRLFEKFDEMATDLSDNGDEYTSIIEISGTTNSEAKSIKVALPPLYRDRTLAMNLFHTTKIDVALPAIVFMRCLEGMPGGIHFAEEVNPKMFLDILQRYIPYRENRII